MPPLWPPSATGPGCTASGRSSVKVTRRLLAQTLPMQFGPDTPSPVCAITAVSSRPSAAALASKPSPKPAEKTGALRAPAGAALERVDDAGCRHQHDHMVGSLRQRLEIVVTGLLPDLAPARI